MLWTLRILIIRMPGIKVKKIKPIICLRPGISKPRPASPTSPSIASKIANDNLSNLVIFQFIMISGLWVDKLSLPILRFTKLCLLPHPFR